MDANLAGDISESHVRHDLISSGHNVLVSLKEGIEYDLVVDINGKFYRIQVKTARPREDRPGSVIIPLRKGDGETYYQDDDFDILAAYIPQSDDVVYANWNNIGQRSLSIKIDTDNLQRPDRVNLVNDYTLESAIEGFK